MLKRAIKIAGIHLSVWMSRLTDRSASMHCTQAGSPFEFIEADNLSMCHDGIQTTRDHPYFVDIYLS